MGTRPCELLNIDPKEEPVLALSVDRAVVTFGRALTYELESVEGKNDKEINAKRLRVMNRWLGVKETGFRSPGSSTVKI